MIKTQYKISIISIAAALLSSTSFAGTDSTIDFDVVAEVQWRQPFQIIYHGRCGRDSLDNPTCPAGQRPDTTMSTCLCYSVTPGPHH